LLNEEITSIGNAAFFNCINLSEIYIPKNVSYIGGLAFGGYMRLKKIFAYPQTPPNSNSQKIFGSLDKNLCLLKVAKGSIENYKKAYEWNEFSHISEIE
jgi:hypothetical protein